MFCTFQSFSQGIIINNTSTGITQIPESAILTAKQYLHIAYGHSSHGSQLTDGMTGLIAFMNGKGYTNNLYSWNNGGTGGALDLHDGAMGGDVGYYPDWVNNTLAYLGTPNSTTGRGTGVNADVNVIIWSWCGQASGLTEATMLSNYLVPMSTLEADYPGIKFVYMTGHLDGSGLTGNLHLRNEQIRNYCRDNGKILYDFEDIESYNPDGVYFGDRIPNDNCDYDSDGNSTLDKNWATDWQNSHTPGVDWYNCSAAHSQPLNANLKAYAAWWLWVSLAGWSPTTEITNEKQDSQVISVFPNPSNGKFTITTNSSSINGIEIFNILGEKVYTIKDSKHETPNLIDISNFQKGIYFIKIYAGGVKYTEKIVSQ